ncbi:hypothetical protein BH23CHL4_BH23CHL4_17180 [soil metagenome]
MPGAQQVIGVDFGTTGVKEVLIDDNGNILAGQTVSHDLHSSHAGGPRRIHGTGSTAHNYGAEGYRHNQILRGGRTERPTSTWTELDDAANAIIEGQRSDNPDFQGFVWQGAPYEGLTCDALE